MNYFLDAFTKKYADFDGRARRLEYWTFVRVNCVISFGLVVLAMGAASVHPKLGLLVAAAYALYTLTSLTPGLAVSVRRLHDTGKSGVWLLLAFVPFGAILLLFYFLEDSERGTNQFGRNPKSVTRRPAKYYDDEDDEDDDDDPPRRRSRARYDDEDDRARRRNRSNDEDDSDDRPRRR